MSIAAIFLIAYRGSDDTESSYKSEQNLGGEYRSTRSPGINLPIGIKRVLEVPVWDQTQGLGQRIPNLISQPSQTPFVFLARFLSVDMIVILRAWAATFIGLAFANVTLAAWGRSALWLRLLFLDLSLLGPLFLYTVRNDFFSQADQYWGLCLMLIALKHPDFFDRSRPKVPRLPLLSFCSLLLGGSFFFAGHPSWLIMGFLALLPWLLPRPIACLARLRSHQHLCLLFMLIPLLVQLIELRSNRVSRLAFYDVQLGLWDVLSCEQVRCVVYPPVAAAAQPILALANRAGDRVEFFNAGLLVPVVIGVFRRCSVPPAVHELLRRSLISIAVMISAMIFSSHISLLNIPLVSDLFSFHVWQLAAPLLIVTTFVGTVTLGHGDLFSRSKPQVSWFLKVITGISIAVAILNPVVAAYHRMDQSVNSVFKDASRRQRGQDLKNGGLLRRYERFVLLEAQDDNMAYGDPLFREAFGLQFELEASRAGFPTVQAVGYGRAIETLTRMTQNFRSMTSPSIKHCSPEVLDFLAVSSIIVETTDDAGCRTRLTSYFGANSVREVPKVSDESESVSIVRPTTFASRGSELGISANPASTCALFEDRCLAGLRVTRLSEMAESPFRLCQEDCVFTYTWARGTNVRQVLLPVNFDDAFRIHDRLTGREYRTANFGGLLAVQIDGDQTRGVFVADIKPDLIMWLRVASTYLNTSVVLSTLALILQRLCRAFLCMK